MFIYTVHLPKRQLIAGGTGILCCAVAVLTALLLTAGGRAVSASAEVKGIRDNADRLGYLEGLGWEVSPAPIAVEELLVPAEFDQSYKAYLALQAGQGFDLTKYAGKRITRYTYEIRNHPAGETGAQVSLLICKNTVIGGEILSTTGNGNLQGLVPSVSVLPSGESHTENAVI